MRSLMNIQNCSTDMTPSSLLIRTFSCKLPASFSRSPMITPWPPIRTAFDRWLTSELDELRLNPCSLHRYTSAAWLSKTLDLAGAAQQYMVKLIRSAKTRVIDRKLIDDYLEDVVELLDACNALRERMEAIKKNAGSLSIALHWLEGDHEPSDTIIERAREALRSCCELMEKRSAELERSGSSLRRLGEKLVTLNVRPCDDTSTPIARFHEALSGSRMVALLAVGMLGIALSFKSRRGLPMVQSRKKTALWMSSLRERQKEVREVFDKRRRDGLVALDELDAAAVAARGLREAISRRGRGGESKMAVDVLRRRCEEMERRVVWPFEGKIDELYRQLIGIRVSLLGMLTDAC